MRKKSTQQKTINYYVTKDKFTKCENFDEKTPNEMQSYISELAVDFGNKSSDQNKKLKGLYSVIEHHIHGKSVILRRYALVSLCLVYKNILPSYKITILKDDQKQQKMKDETIKTYSEEEILLNHYQKYVSVIESVLEKNYNIENLKHIKWTEADHLTLLNCACDLYLNNPNFNCAGTLLKVILPFLNSRNIEMLKCATKMVKTAINDDLKLEVSFKICDIIKQLVVKNKFDIRYTVLKPLLALDLEDVNVDQGDKKVTRSVMSRKEKKVFKSTKKQREKTEEMNAKESLSTKSKMNSKIISTIFYIYFRILKRNKISAQLLEIVLESIGKFGRLVDCKLIPDIFSITGKIVDNSKVSLENRLRGLFVCLNIITSGKSSEILEIDPGNFCTKLINVTSNANLTETSAILLIKCCTKLLVKRRNHIARNDTEGIIKVLIKSAYNNKNLPHICSLILISLVKYLRLYPQIQYLFDDEDEEIPMETNTADNKVLPNEYLGYLQILGKISIYEISGVAKKIKKFFLHVDDNLFDIKDAFEELTRLKADECLEHLKNKLHLPAKRHHGECNEEEQQIKKLKR